MTTALLLLGACGAGGSSTAPVVVGKGHDNDADELGSALETAGWEILIDDKGFGPFNNGATLTRRHVTSDPNLDDTDGDGVLDGDEYHLRTDPREEDTDGDGLTDYEEWKRWLTSPVSVDTDGDARGPDVNNPLAPNPDLFDGAELHFDANGRLLGTSTSPILADTDGDGATDYEEVGHAFRSLVIAEIPDVRILMDGPIDVFLNVEYAESNGQETTYGTSVSTTRSDTTSTGSSNTLEENLRLSATVTAGVEGEAGTLGASATVSGEVSATVEQSWMAGTTQTTTQESTKALQQESSKLETDRRENTEIAASGTITAGITIENTSPASTVRLESLGVAIRHWQSDGRGGREFRTLGTLRPDIPGFTLPPGGRTPVLRLGADDVAPDVIRRFLSEPGTLHLAPAYFDLVDEQGIDYAFLAENAFSQTAVVEINYGDGDAESYRVATNVNRTAQGELAGITMREVMTSIVGIPWAEAPSTTSICGANPMVLSEIDGRVGSTGFVLGVDDPKTFRIWRTAMNRPGFTNCGDWGDIVLMPGDVITLTYAKDTDGDGLTDATEESLGTKNSEDCDLDGLKDGAEAALGWWAGAPGVEATAVPAADRILLSAFGYPRLVYSNPRLADTDGDGLNDHDEKWKGCDPTAPDTDGDGVLDGVDPFPLIRGVRLFVDASVSGGDGSSWQQAYDSVAQAVIAAKLANDRAIFTEIRGFGATLLEKVDSVRQPDGTHLATNLVWGKTIVSEIWVANGVYPSASPIRLLQHASIYGGFSGAGPDGDEETTRGARNEDPTSNGTVLAGSGASNRVVEAAGTVTRSSVLDGFVITGADGIARTGGGIHCVTSPTLRNLLITNNVAHQGGGIHISGGAPLIDRCLFSQNRCTDTSGAAGGGAFITHSSVRPAPVFRDCQFVANVGRGAGGALYAQGVTGLVIEDCEVSGNTCIEGDRAEMLGAGVHLRDCSTRISNTLFDGNSTSPSIDSRAHTPHFSYDLYTHTRGESFSETNPAALPDHRCGGAVYQHHGELTVAQCVFRGNAASHGAGIRARGRGATLAVVQSTFADNEITVFGSAISTVETDLILRNSIFGAGIRQSEQIKAVAHLSNPAVGAALLAQIELNFDPIFLGTKRPPSVNFLSLNQGFTIDHQNCLFADPAGQLFAPNRINMGALGNRVGPADFMGPYDLRLSAGSRAIDAGNSQADYLPISSGFQPLPATDVAGKSRIVDGDGDGDARVDMGAYEYR